MVLNIQMARYIPLESVFFKNYDLTKGNFTINSVPMPTFDFT